MRPVVHGLEDTYAAKVDFVYLDIDDPTSDAAKRKLGYRVQPDLYLIDAQGNIVQRWIGLVQAKSLEEALSKIK
jgi:hypothetical protein